ncbi:MAG: 50S ribosomal protein L11 methyltransferase [Planctomycetota bacterium]
MNIDEQRFGFGANWQDFSGQIDEARIERAIDSLRELLGVRGLSGCRFLDIGSGSGLFSLAASRLGAQVVALDYDPDSVRCTRAVLSQDSASSDGSTAGAPPTWHVHQGSVLDADWMASFDNAPTA